MARSTARRVLVAMSGGVDSSVAAARLLDAGHEVVGVTLKLWGGDGDSGCCSVADVDDARRVAAQLGVDHYVFGLADEFARAVVDPYVDAHARGLTPNPCIECNRHIKFQVLLDRAHRLGFDALATGHHARVERRGGRFELRRSRDAAKDQSYVLSMLGRAELSRVLLPIGDLTKAEVRAAASSLGLRTAAKPDSQDVCFIASEPGRAGFLADRIPLQPARLVDVDGTVVGTVDAVQLVTIGQRRGLGLGGRPERRYVTGVDVERGVVAVGPHDDLMVAEQRVGTVAWVDGARTGPCLVQGSAHGRTVDASLDDDGAGGLVVRYRRRARIVSPGQTLAFYDRDDPDRVLGSGVVAGPAAAASG